MKKLSLSFLFISCVFQLTHAQDTLPKFSVKDVGNNRIILSWTNRFETIKQISIQRSFDSLRNYKTILTVPDPTTKQNGYLDAKATNDHMFYRLFILLDKGVYLFSDAKRPIFDSLKKSEFVQEKINGIDTTGMATLSVPKKTPPAGFVPSLHVFTSKDGYVRINLPEDENKKYSIKFYDNDENFLFELKDIKQRSAKIDKTDFYHAGWFHFELFENDKLIEKHKFYLEKDF